MDKLVIMKTHDTAKVFPYFLVLANVSLRIKSKCAHSLRKVTAAVDFQIKLLGWGPSAAISVTRIVADPNSCDKKMPCSALC